MNAKIKVVGGATDLTENESSLQRWLIGGPEIGLIGRPEIACILDEFEGTLHITSNEVQEHHNSTISAQSSS